MKYLKIVLARLFVKMLYCKRAVVNPIKLNRKQILQEISIGKNVQRENYEYHVFLIKHSIYSYRSVLYNVTCLKRKI